MVTKQEQLKWLAHKYKTWPEQGATYLGLSVAEVGKFAIVNCHLITRKEWQQERDKMQNEKSVITGGIYLTRNGFRFEVVDIAKAGSDCSVDMVVYVNLDATNDFPPGQKWVLELESFISKFKLDSGRKPAPDNSWHERGELPPVGCVCLYVISDRCSCEVEITSHARFGICFVEIGKSGENYVSKTAEKHRFRPLRTEREKVIDEMANLIAKSVFGSAKCQAEKLYDAGYRKIASK